jgi:CBS-domain-containing membrane protein
MPMVAKPLLALVARDLMNKEVATIPLDLGMQTAARWLAQLHVSGAPVVDERGRCVGVLSSNDFVSCCAANRSRCGKNRTEVRVGPCTDPDCVGCEWQMVQPESVEGTVREYMTPNPATARPDTPIAKLAEMMVDAHLHRLIIVDEQDRPVGVVSSTDIVAAVARFGHEE